MTCMSIAETPTLKTGFAIEPTTPIRWIFTLSLFFVK